MAEQNPNINSNVQEPDNKPNDNKTTQHTYTQEQLDSIVSTRERAALQSFFEKQGLSEDEIKKAVSTYKEGKDKNTPDIAAITAEKQKYIQQVLNAQIENIKHLLRMFCLYRNVKCRKESSAYGYGQAFGCGYDDGLTFVFENCLFDSQQGGAGLSMHNTNGYGSNNVTFTDCQFISSGIAALSFYNSSTVQLYNTVNISNCYLNKMLALSINGDLNASGRINAYKLYINNCNDFTVYTRPNLTNNLEATVYNTIKS